MRQGPAHVLRTAQNLRHSTAPGDTPPPPAHLPQLHRLQADVRAHEDGGPPKGALVEQPLNRVVLGQELGGGGLDVRPQLLAERVDPLHARRVWLGGPAAQELGLLEV